MYNPVLSIDVSKSKSYAAAFKSYSEPFLKPTSFLHNPKGLNYMLKCLENLETETKVKPQVVLEATGNYSKPLTTFFQSKNYDVIVLNPIETHIEKKKTVRKIKTDPVDANRIARVYYLNNFLPQSRVDGNTMELRNLCRQLDGFNALYTETQLKLRSVLNLVFPGFDKVFAHIRSKTALNVLSLFPTPQAILNARKEELLEALKPARHSRAWNEEKVDKLKTAARESLPDTSAQQSYERVIKSYIELLNTHQKIMTDIRAQIVSLAELSPIYELLRSIPGVGELTAATILSEIGDVFRFPTVKQLVAFAGLDPSIYQSGKFKSTNNKISKRGSTYLRKALYQATVAGVTKRVGGPLNSVLFEFYSKKLSEGKPTRVAIVAASNKLLRMVYGIWKSGCPFTVS
jgi:transposase